MGLQAQQAQGPVARATLCRWVSYLPRRTQSHCADCVRCFKTQADPLLWQSRKCWVVSFPRRGVQDVRARVNPELMLWLHTPRWSDFTRTGSVGRGGHCLGCWPGHPPPHVAPRSTTARWAHPHPGCHPSCGRPGPSQGSAGTRAGQEAGQHVAAVRRRPTCQGWEDRLVARRQGPEAGGDTPVPSPRCSPGCPTSLALLLEAPSCWLCVTCSEELA